MNNILIIGASLGGLVAASELRNKGNNVTIIDKSKSVGGLYNKTVTPFGVQELGMHVLYANNKHFDHLCHIFGEEIFHILKGCQVDVGASANFGTVNFDSLYPNIMGHVSKKAIYNEILMAKGKGAISSNALQEVVNRFGEIGGREVVAPILEKLWHTPAETLTKHALHCFFDLRRMIVCDKTEADDLKTDPWLDDVIGNPIQNQPRSKVFGGRMGLTFKSEHPNLSDRVISWANREGINIEMGRKVSVEDGCLMVEDKPVHENCDSCIVSLPFHTLAAESIDQTDQLELSIYYFQLSETLNDQFPAYYILCHDRKFKSSRIVNYDAYNQENSAGISSVLSVESVHRIGSPPTEDEIAKEVMSVIPSIQVHDSHRLKHSIRVLPPTLKNAEILDLVACNLQKCFSDKNLFFTGMRTDTGIFFSHQTIGLAYESALECCKQYS